MHIYGADILHLTDSESQEEQHADQGPVQFSLCFTSTPQLKVCILCNARVRLTEKRARREESLQQDIKSSGHGRTNSAGNYMQRS